MYHADKSASFIVKVVYIIYCMPLFMLAFSIHNFLALNQKMSKNLQMQGLNEIIDDWDASFITGLKVIDASEKCESVGGHDIFHYAWYGLRYGWYGED